MNCVGGKDCDVTTCWDVLTFMYTKHCFCNTYNEKEKERLLYSFIFYAIAQLII